MAHPDNPVWVPPLGDPDDNDDLTPPFLGGPPLPPPNVEDFEDEDFED